VAAGAYRIRRQIMKKVLLVCSLFLCLLGVAFSQEYEHIGRNIQEFMGHPVERVEVPVEVPLEDRVFLFITDRTFEDLYASVYKVYYDEDAVMHGYFPGTGELLATVGENWHRSVDVGVLSRPLYTTQLAGSGERAGGNLDWRRPGRRHCFRPPRYYLLSFRLARNEEGVRYSPEMVE
jgi:hypothetical protein